jgi:hypothetical protein
MIRRKNTPRRKRRKRSTKMVRLNYVSFSSVLSSFCERRRKGERESDFDFGKPLFLSKKGLR